MPSTIMLGLHQYCESVGRITAYLNGKYSYSLNKEQTDIASIKERLSEGIDFPESWIDLFFISDVLMIGFGLLYEEIDLWWILASRKRLIRQGVALNNHVYYCGTVEPGKRKLLETLDVEIVEPSNWADDYATQYISELDKVGW